MVEAGVINTLGGWILIFGNGRKGPVGLKTENILATTAFYNVARGTGTREQIQSPTYNSARCTFSDMRFLNSDISCVSLEIYNTNPPQMLLQPSPLTSSCPSRSSSP
jgi:hypothetical protein